MKGSGRFAVAKRLAGLGLRKTLIAVKSADGLAVSRIRRLDETVELTPVGKCSSAHAPVIGRVGLPDHQLGIPWKNSMPFYGRWFDEVGETDSGYHLRRNISSLSHKHMLEQISRDDQYALIGSYYSVFQTIMEVKGRVPLVLITDTYVPLVSFPVILPKIEDKDLERTMLAVLRRMLRPDVVARVPIESEVPGTDGIEVDEISADEAAGGAAADNSPD